MQCALAYSRSDECNPYASHVYEAESSDVLDRGDFGRARHFQSEARQVSDETEELARAWEAAD